MQIKDNTSQTLNCVLLDDIGLPIKYHACRMMSNCTSQVDVGSSITRQHKSQMGSHALLVGVRSSFVG